VINAIKKNEDNVVFTEFSAMGGNNLYSCSKEAAEFISNCYRTFFLKEKYIFGKW